MAGLRRGCAALRIEETTIGLQVADRALLSVIRGRHHDRIKRTPLGAPRIDLDQEKSAICNLFLQFERRISAVASGFEAGVVGVSKRRNQGRSRNPIRNARRRKAHVRQVVSGFRCRKMRGPPGAAFA